MSVFELRDGDCFTTATGADVGRVIIVPCDGAWDFHVVNSFAVDDQPDYPERSFFDAVAGERCMPPSETYLSPSPGSWAGGDRVILCVEAG